MKVVVHEGHYIKIVLRMHTIDQAIIKLPSYHNLSRAVVAYWIERRTCNPRLWVRISGPAGIVGGQFISTFNTTTEVRPLSMAPNSQLLPGRVCVHYCVCGCVKCRAQIPSMGHHTWPHVTSNSNKSTSAISCCVCVCVDSYCWFK